MASCVQKLIHIHSFKRTIYFQIHNNDLALFFSLSYTIDYHSNFKQNLFLAVSLFKIVYSVPTQGSSSQNFVDILQNVHTNNVEQITFAKISMAPRLKTPSQYEL